MPAHGRCRRSAAAPPARRTRPGPRPAARRRTPAGTAGRGAERHQLDGVDAELHQPVQPPGRGVERPGGCEGGDVQLVHHPSWQCRAGPVGVLPAVQTRVEESGRAADTGWLPARPRVRQQPPAVDPQPVVRTGRQLADPLPGSPSRLSGTGWESRTASSVLASGAQTHGPGHRAAGQRRTPAAVSSASLAASMKLVWVPAVPQAYAPAIAPAVAAASSGPPARTVRRNAAT